MPDMINQITIGLSRPYFRNILKRLQEKNVEMRMYYVNTSLLNKQKLILKIAQRKEKSRYWYGFQIFLMTKKSIRK